MPKKDRIKYNEYMSKQVLARYHKRRKQVIELLGGICVLCGTTEKLEVDHIDPTTKSFPISKLWGISWSRLAAELNKCQLLCKTCHIKKTTYESKIRRPITHGKYWAAYKHGCKCKLCIDFKLDYNSVRRIRRSKSSSCNSMVE